MPACDSRTVELNVLAALQRELAARVVVRPFDGMPRRVAAIDASFPSEDRICAVAVLYDTAAHAVIETAHEIRPVTMPYVPGFLSFREIDATLAAVSRLPGRFDLLLVDGQGLAHPRRFGFACHLGVTLAVPAIGCAKTRLTGRYDEPAATKGSASPLIVDGEVVGSVVRTRDGVRPLFVSPGHLVDVQSSVRIVLGLTGRYRLPEPQRAAHNLTMRLKRP